MSVAIPIKSHSALTWLTLGAALAACVFYLDGIVQYWSVPIAFDPNSPGGKGIIPLTIFEHWSLVATRGQSLIWAKLGHAALGAVGIAAALFAALLMWRAPDNAAGRQVAGLAIAYAVFGAAAYFLPWLPEYEALRTQLASVGAEWAAISGLLGISLMYFAVGFARFLTIFPRAVDVESVHVAYLKRPLLLRWTGNQPVEKSTFLPRWHALLVSGRIFWLVAIFVALAFAVEGTSLLKISPLGMIVESLNLVAMFVCLGFYFFVGLPYAFASISHLYHFGTADERRRVAWLRAMTLCGGLALIPVLLVLLISMASRRPGMESLAPILGPTLVNLITLYCGLVIFLFLPTAILALGVAVFRGGAIDPRVAFTRVTLWSTVGLLVTVAFILIERFAAIKLVEWFQLPPDTGAVAAGAIMAGTFVPIRNFASGRINQLAERWVPLETIAEGSRVKKLVVIADLSGYTALSATDEPAALLQSAALRRQGERITSLHGGTFIKSLGDAVMLTFANVNAGLQATLELHREFPTAIDAVGLVPLKLHSALHFGEIVESRDGDIFGQTVNVTARLVDAAAAGEIVVSGDAKALIEAADSYRDLGLKKFKNVPDAVQCYQWCPAVALVTEAATPPV